MATWTTVFFLGATLCGIVAAIVAVQMLADISRQLPKGIPGGERSSFRTTWREHRRLYPGSYRRGAYVALSVLALALVMAGFASFVRYLVTTP